jgi:hypothetical protein
MAAGHSRAKTSLYGQLGVRESVRAGTWHSRDHSAAAMLVVLRRTGARRRRAARQNKGNVGGAPA